MTPRVSVIIPVFNKAKWIEETLMSVVCQSYKDWECIIIDDGSTDNSLDVVYNFTNKHPGVWKIITQSNRGQCVARNRGIEESSGEYIAFLDGDDCWSENKLEVQVSMLSENKNASLVICPYLIYEEGVSKFGKRFVVHSNTRKMLKNWLNLRGFGAGTESTGLVRKNFLVLIGGFDSKLSTSAGLDLTIRLSRCGEILTAKNTYMKYRIHTGQWHSNLEILSLDLDLLREKISGSSDSQRTKIALAHAAYLHLQELRQGFPLRKVIGLRRDRRSYYYLMVLVLCILRRNLVARARAIFPGFLTKIPNTHYSGLFS